MTTNNNKAFDDAIKSVFLDKLNIDDPDRVDEILNNIKNNMITQPLPNIIPNNEFTKLFNTDENTELNTVMKYTGNTINNITCKVHDVIERCMKDKGTSLNYNKCLTFIYNDIKKYYGCDCFCVLLEHVFGNIPTVINKLLQYKKLKKDSVGNLDKFKYDIKAYNADAKIKLDGIFFELDLSIGVIKSYDKQKILDTIGDINSTYTDHLLNALFQESITESIFVNMSTKIKDVMNQIRFIVDLDNGVYKLKPEFITYELNFIDKNKLLNAYLENSLKTIVRTTSFSLLKCINKLYDRTRIYKCKLNGRDIVFYIGVSKEGQECLSQSECNKFLKYMTIANEVFDININTPFIAHFYLLPDNDEYCATLSDYENSKPIKVIGHMSFLYKRCDNMYKEFINQYVYSSKSKDMHKHMRQKHKLK